MIIDILSDLHGSFPDLPGGDLLILGGDYTARHNAVEYDRFKIWLNNQSYAKKIVIGGNHDTDFKVGNVCKDAGQFRFTRDWLDAIYLEDSGCEYEGIKIWGSPWTAWFDGINPNCKAWTLRNDKALAKKWALIPDDTDILITHSPPCGILDECLSGDKFENVGSKSLRARVFEINPKLHVFGHIHEGYGQIKLDDIIFVNASHMDVNYKPVNKPIRITLT